MATSETISTPSEWMQFYQTNFSDINQIHPQPTAATSSAASRNNNFIPNHGRISKPLRRRARPSRRTATALFNTDAVNFRSMVQRFTGCPISPFAAGSQLPIGSETFVFDATNEAATTIARPATGFRMQYSHQPQQQMFTTNKMQGGSGEVVPSHAPPGFSITEDRSDYNNYMM